MLRKAFVGAAGALFALAPVNVKDVRAADFGGDCCADLEERIAELEATTARKNTRKTSLYIYGEVNQAVMFWDDGAGSDVYVVSNATTKTKFGFEGQAQIDRDWSAGFRIEIDVRQASSEAVDQGQTTVAATGGGFFAGRVTLLGAGDDGFNNNLVIRDANWFLKSKTFGTLVVGQGSQATDGIAEIDLSGSGSVAGSAVETWNEAFFLRNGAGQTPFTLTRTSIAQFLDQAGVFTFGATRYADLFVGNMDGGRGNFVQYVSPTFVGFTLSAAWGEDDDWDVALRYAEKWGEFNVAAGIGYREGVTTDTESINELFPTVELEQKVVVGSASIIHQPTGLFLTAAGGQTDYGDFLVNGRRVQGGNGLRAFDLLDAKYLYLKGGIYQKFSPIGKTSIYGEYYRAWDIGSRPSTSDNINTFDPDDVFNETAESFGVGMVQHVDAAAMELYVAYRHYWADDVTNFFSVGDTTIPVENDIKMDMVMTGARIKF